MINEEQIAETLMNFDPTNPRVMADISEPTHRDTPTPTAELNFHKMFALFIDSVADCVVARMGNGFAEKRISEVVQKHDSWIISAVLNSPEFDKAVKGLIEDADIPDIVDDKIHELVDGWKFKEAVTEVVRELDFEFDCKVRVS